MLRVKMLAYAQATVGVFEKAKRKYAPLFNPEQIEFVNDRPDVLMFISGGSERVAVECVQDFGFYLLIANQENNSWASALEVRAWMQQHNIHSQLVDADSPEAAELIQDFYFAVEGVKRLHGQKLGVVGTPSDWLVASTPSRYVLQSRFGIETVNVVWDDIVFDEIQQVSAKFAATFLDRDDDSQTVDNELNNSDIAQSNLSQHFNNADISGLQKSVDCSEIDLKSLNSELYESGRIYEGLVSFVPFYGLNALSVECFPMARQTGHTACLALAQLNSEGIPAACEADNVSAVAMMFALAVCGQIPWMANTIHFEGSKLRFAHCTAPLDLLSSFKIDTHFETGGGQAVAGVFAADQVTVFRFNSLFDKIFVTSAQVLSRPRLKTACRTQLEVEVSPNTARYFAEQAFGNHHLILPGNMVQRLQFAARLLQIDVVQ